MTVVTDLGGAHSTWFDRRADAVFVPPDAVKKLAIRRDFEMTRSPRGLPIRPSFWKKGGARKS